MQVDLLTQRMGVFAKLSEVAGVEFGRTALMKLCYLLQEVKNVPLGYTFSLYSYGPFDSDVLADLQTAQELRVLDSSVQQFQSGYGYALSQSTNADKVKRASEDFLSKYSSEITSVAQNFARRSASELELVSTILFVFNDKKKISDPALVALVKAIKPRFSPEEISSKIVWIRDQGLFGREQTV